MKTHQQRDDNPSRAAWRRVIEYWHQSGKSQRHYCEDAGLSYQQFLRWRRHLEGDEGSVSFATLDLSPTAPLASATESGLLEIEVSDRFRVKVTEQTSSSLLTMALQCLEGLC
jgi:hypothetical protein